MRTETKTYEIYTFDELSAKAKAKALDFHREWNVSDEYWYESIVDDAKELGITIHAFDTSRMSITLHFKGEHLDTIANRILKEYGKESKLYIAALEFLTETAQASNQHVSEELLESFLEDLEKEFRSELHAYFIEELNSQYEYLISDEAIADSLIANDLEFLIDGSDY